LNAGAATASPPGPNEFAGFGGLRTASVEDAPEVEVLWTILPHLQNQGLATEMARAAIATGFSQLRLPRIVAFTLPDNLPSRRVMEKCGLLFERTFFHAGLEHVLYSIHAPQR
jgi:RimJ/RimL family protein N-acetyltransferase